MDAWAREARTASTHAAAAELDETQPYLGKRDTGRAPSSSEARGRH